MTHNSKQELKDCGDVFKISCFHHQFTKHIMFTMKRMEKLPRKTTSVLVIFTNSLNYEQSFTIITYLLIYLQSVFVNTIFTTLYENEI